ncbi:hypothetical protein POUND7_013416, partial [Theobroma cacao]
FIKLTVCIYESITLIYLLTIICRITTSLQADVYDDGSGACAAFPANMDDKTDKNVVFRNVSYHLLAWSVSILPDCKNVVFNTAKISSQVSVVEMVPEELQPSVALPSKDLKALKWDIFVENAGICGAADFTKNGFVDHINTTKDTSDYVWYTTSIIVGENEEFLKKGSHPVLLIESKGHAFHAFVNQELQGSASGNGSHSPFKFENPISLKAGENEIALLSMTVGLQNAGGLYEWVGAGLTSVKIEGLNNGTVDLSMSSWTYKIGLQGEHLGIYKREILAGVNWVSTSEPPKNQLLTWYKVVVDPPSGDEPVGLDMIRVGKGLAWLNGEEIGRYWPIESSKHLECVQECDYRGKFFPDKCLTGCGEPTQRWYHVPRSWFKPSGNILVIFEEKGGDPTKIRFSKRKTSGLCSHIAEDYPMVDQESISKDGNGNDKTRPTVHLKCPKNTWISNVCLGKNECAIELTEEKFDKSLCPGTTKKLAIEAVCS